MSRPRAKVGDLSFNFGFAEHQQIKGHRVALAERQNDEASRKLAAVAKERELEERRHGGTSKPSRGRPYILDKARLRLLDITRIIRDKFGGPAITDDADLFLKVAAPSLMHAGGGPDTDGAKAEFLKFREQWTPEVGEAEALEILRDVERNALHGQKVHTTPDEAAKALGITSETMWRLDLKTINAVGVNANQRKAEYRNREKARQQAIRDQAGCTRRADSKARTEPWKALGIGRSKFYELQKAGQLPAVPELAAPTGITPSIQSADSFVAIGSVEPHLARTDQSGARYAVAGPARLGQARRTRRASGLTPSDRIKAVTASPTVPLLLPGGEWSNQCDLFGRPSSLPETSQGRVSATPSAPAAALASLDGWHGGAMPAEALALISTITHARGLRSRAAVAREMGLERQTLANAWHGTYGLGSAKVERVKAWIATHLQEAA